MEGENNMKDFTAKELENLFSKKQLSAYNQKLKRELYLLKMDYNKVLETRDSYIEKEIPSILLILAYGDIIAVDESLMDSEKYRRIKNCYKFFMQINEEKMQRNKEEVVIERICDIIGENKVQNLKSKFDIILQKYNIEKEQFVEDMYNIKIKLLLYTKVNQDHKL